MTDLAEVQKSLAAHWQGRSPTEFANELSAPLYGTAGEWDLPKGVEPKRELLYLAVGIPDAQSLPKQALADAAAATLNQPGDLALRYGFENPGRFAAEYRQRFGEYPSQTLRS